MKKSHLRKNRSAGRFHQQKPRSQKSRRPHFEKLEDRWLLSAVGFNSLSDVTLAAGTTMFIPLNSTDAGQTVSYAVTASDYSKLTPNITPQTNKTLQFNVLINGVSQPMDFQLFDNLAPTTTAKIEQLVNSGFYNGLQIYRNGKDGGNPFVLQGGNIPPTGPIKTEQPSIAEEFNPNLQYTTADILAMAPPACRAVPQPSFSSPRSQPAFSTSTTRCSVFRPAGRAWTKRFRPWPMKTVPKTRAALDTSSIP